LSALFSADWATCAGKDAPMLTPAASAPGRLIVGPSHTPRRRLAELVLSARRRVRLLDAKLDDPEMLNLLESARANGITVDIRRETRLGRWRSHGKLLLIDQRVAVIGSMAWSSRSLDERRELSIVIRDRGLVAELDAFWRSLPVRSGLRAGAPLREERCA
jgi:phosphatidylserine/phosphatidylglycerophosphate/cardiolipin synthase-like enzyme